MEATLPRLGTGRYGDGGAAPTRGPGGANPVLGMLLFVACETMFFAGLISAFIVLRAGVGVWPPPDQPRFPLGVTAVNTLVLLASGVMMVRARTAVRTGHPMVGRTRLAWTAALGTIFLLVQGVEWIRLLSHGLQIAQAVYGGLFVALIGAHATHVAGGVAAVLWAWRGDARMGWTHRTVDALTAVQIYWCFVVGVWPVLYVLVYG